MKTSVCFSLKFPLSSAHARIRVSESSSSHPITSLSPLLSMPKMVVNAHPTAEVS